MLLSCRYRLLWPPVARLTIIFFVGYMAPCTTDHRVAWPESRKGTSNTEFFVYFLYMKIFNLK